MRIMLGEDDVERLFLGEVLKVTHSGGVVEVAMSDIGFARLHELLTQAQAATQQRAAPGPAPTPEGGDRIAEPYDAT